ncbi:LOW QUALITY PROTEIN: hypothetical protein PanWU01x14_087750, partial [Parasponia andersonii]
HRRAWGSPSRTRRLVSSSSSSDDFPSLLPTGIGGSVVNRVHAGVLRHGSKKQEATSSKHLNYIYIYIKLKTCKRKEKYIKVELQSIKKCF